MVFQRTCITPIGQEPLSCGLGGSFPWNTHLISSIRIFTPRIGETKAIFAPPPSEAPPKTSETTPGIPASPASDRGSPGRPPRPTGAPHGLPEVTGLEARRPRRTSIGWVIRRSWHRVGVRLTFATSAPGPEAASLRAHSAVTRSRHGNVQGNRRPYDGDGVDWSTRHGPT
jgi:hypothetical protein